MQIEQLLEHLNVVVLHDLAHLAEVRENVSICLRVWREEKRRKHGFVLLQKACARIKTGGDLTWLRCCSWQLQSAKVSAHMLKQWLVLMLLLLSSSFFGRSRCSEDVSCCCGPVRLAAHKVALLTLLEVLQVHGEPLLVDPLLQLIVCRPLSVNLRLLRLLLLLNLL